MVLRGTVVTVVVIVVAACGQGAEPEAVVEDTALGPLVEEPAAESADSTAAATITTAEERLEDSVSESTSRWRDRAP